MRVFLTLAALAVAALGWAGATSLGGPEAAGFLGGALTLAGALVICGLFTFHARWLGVGGAAVVALLGAARNLPALLELVRGSAGRPDLCRLTITVVCVAVFVVAGRVVLRERRGPDGPA